MSSSPASWDPYVPPQIPAAPPLPAGSGGLPTGVKAVCITAIILGGFGTVISCVGAAGMVLGPALNQAIEMRADARLDAGMDERLADAREELQEQMAAISRQYLPFTVASLVVHLLSGLALLLGGILTLRVSATGRLILLTGLVLAAVYEVVHGVLNVVVQMRSAPAVQRFMDQALPQGGQAAEFQPAFAQFMLVIMFVTLAVALGATLVKLAFYVWSTVYLKKPHIRAHFAA